MEDYFTFIHNHLSRGATIKTVNGDCWVVEKYEKFTQKVHLTNGRILSLQYVFSCYSRIQFAHEYGEMVIETTKNMDLPKFEIKKPISEKRAKKKKKTKTQKLQELLQTIDDRANGRCCLCVTFRELRKIKESDFIKMMKKQYTNISDYKLEKEKIQSWRDEYNQIVKYFIPTIGKNNNADLDFYVVFEMKLPMRVSDLEYDEYVYSDAIIVGEDGFVILEFKQREADVVEHYVTQANKYMHRLRFHKIGRRQSLRFTYMVFTKELEDGVWCYDDKEDFWYGNSKSVARDLCEEFFDNTYPYKDIKEWLAAGFREKHKSK